jgi:hypothetical protein
LLLLVILAGGLGGSIHTATSYATYIGNKSFVKSWSWWYVLRPFIGMALALLFYFALRGGIIMVTGDSSGEDLNPFGIAAIAGMVGMFSKQAADKLRELFDNMFKTEKGKGDDERADKLRAMLPVRDFMLGVNKISAYHMKKDEAKEKVKIKALYDLLKGIVTRLPVFDHEGKVECVIHEGSLFKYISKKSIEGEVSPGQPFTIKDLLLKDFLDFEDNRKLVEETMAFVSAEATLGDAKKEMEKNPKCQDVFVTETGKKKEPVIGWLTNIEISRHTSCVV